MPTPAPATTTGNRGQKSDTPATNAPVYQLPRLDQITHVATAKRTYEMADYRAIYIQAADAKARQEAIKKGVDPLALRLFGSDVLVLIKRGDSKTRIIPLNQVVEFTIEAAKAPKTS